MILYIFVVSLVTSPLLFLILFIWPSLFHDEFGKKFIIFFKIFLQTNF